MLKHLLCPTLVKLKAAASNSEFWLSVMWGSVGKARSDGGAHADLLTAAGCRLQTADGLLS